MSKLIVEDYSEDRANYFANQFNTATAFINDTSNEFKEVTKRINVKLRKQIKITQSKPVVSISRNMSFLGTMIDEYMINVITKKPFLYKNLVDQTKQTIRFRSFMPDFENTNFDLIKLSFNKLQPFIDTLIENLMGKVVINPVFNNKYLRADCDYLINNVLTEVKVSTNRTFQVKYLRQLLVYMYLNKSNQNQYDVNYGKIGIIMPNYNYANLNINLNAAIEESGTSLEQLFTMIKKDIATEYSKRL